MRSMLPLRAIAMMLPCALLAACVATVISPPALRCTDLLPSRWEAGVEPAPLPEGMKLPDGHDDARPWQRGFVEQTGQLEKANGRYSDATGIVKRCEARNVEAVEAAKPSFLGIF